MHRDDASAHESARAPLMSESAQWQLGIVLGVVVILVAALIVITIVMLAMRISRQARTAVGAVEVLRQQTDELSGIEHDQ